MLREQMCVCVRVEVRGGVRPGATITVNKGATSATYLVEGGGSQARCNK